MIRYFTQDNQNRVTRLFVAINPDNNDEIAKQAQQIRGKYSRALGRIGGSSLIEAIIRDNHQMAVMKRSAAQRLGVNFSNMVTLDKPYGQATLNSLISLRDNIAAFQNAMGISAHDVKAGGIDNIDRNIRYIAFSGATSGVHWTSSNVDSVSAEDYLIMRLASVGVNGYYNGDITAPEQALMNIKAQVKDNDEISSYLDFIEMQQFAKSKLAPSKESTALLGCMLLSEYDSKKESVSNRTIVAQHVNTVITEYGRYQLDNDKVAPVHNIVSYVESHEGENWGSNQCGRLIQQAVDKSCGAKSIGSTRMLSEESIIYAYTDQIVGKGGTYEDMTELEGAMLGQSKGRIVDFSGDHLNNPAHIGLYLYKKDGEAYGGQSTTRGTDGFIEIRPLNQSKDKWDIVGWHEDIKKDLTDKDLWLVTDEDYSFLFSDK